MRKLRDTEQAIPQDKAQGKVQDKVQDKVQGPTCQPQMAICPRCGLPVKEGEVRCPRCLCLLVILDCSRCQQKNKCSR